MKSHTYPLPFLHPPPPTSSTHLHTRTHTHTHSDEEFVDLEKEFEQNELNSAVYLISIAMQLSNFAVNYKVRGRMNIVTLR